MGFYSYYIYYLFISNGTNAYASVRNKWFMDIKYISIYKIISYIGIIGFVFSLIILFISSFIPYLNETKFICNFSYDNSKFYENFRSLEDINIIEILILIPLYLVSNFLSIYFYLLIINYLDPFYLIPIDTCYYIIYETVDFFITLSITNIYSNIRFCLAISSDLISVICCCIYLEIFELHFYNLAENIKKNIISRGEFDRKSTELQKKLNDNNDNDDENDNNEETSY